MKKIILISSLAASALALTACNQTARNSSSSYDESSSSMPTMAPVAADPGPAPAAPSEPGLLAASSSSSSSLSDPSVSTVPTASSSVGDPSIGASLAHSSATATPEPMTPMAPSAPVLTDNTAPISAQSPEASALDPIAVRIAEWRLGATDIQNDLDSGKAITRSVSSTSASAFTPMSSSTADGFSLSNVVKGRLASDRQLSSADIQTEATGGEIRLSGSLSSAELVGRAIAISLDTPGVTSVTSSIKVASASGTP